jgi:hypothetical protein
VPGLCADAHILDRKGGNELAPPQRPRVRSRFVRWDVHPSHEEEHMATLSMAITIIETLVSPTSTK